MLEVTLVLRKLATSRMSKLTLVYLAFGIIFILPIKAFAQLDSLSRRKGSTDCESSLALATSEFNSGRFFSLPAILKNCLSKGFTKEQEVRAYILLCQVYLINDNPLEAENSYLKLLKADPEYIASPDTDPIDVVFLSKKFTTRPIFTPHLKAGWNVADITILRHINSNSEPENITQSYLLKPGFSMGGGIDWNASDRFSLSADILWSSRVFQKNTRGMFILDESRQKTILNWIDFPIYIKFQDYTGLLRPYVYSGFALHAKISSKAQLEYLNKDKSAIEGDPETQSITEGKDVYFTDKQVFLNRSFVIGGGAKYKNGKNFFLVDLRIQLGLNNVTIGDKTIEAADQGLGLDVSKYDFINDFYRVNSFTLSLGYIFPFYNPRKTSGWQPKGFLRKFLYGNK